jgi:hypothetical protein
MPKCGAARFVLTAFETKHFTAASWLDVHLFCALAPGAAAAKTPSHTPANTIVLKPICIAP